jgi:S-DNA-T family DNA segregation ATPase FtsK/SpoIIIE
MVGMDPLPIVLPAAPSSPRRAPLPYVAACMPVLAGVVLWMITGSLFALCFAALGPVMMLASFVDSSRGRRRERRRLDEETEQAWTAAQDELEQLQREERLRLRTRHPDAATGIAQTPLRGSAPVDGETLLVVGRGTVPSTIRTTGGDGERARAFQERSRALDAAPIRVPIQRGICLRGPEPIVLAAVRALVIQLSLRFGPSQLAFAGERGEERGFGLLPHAARNRRSAFRIGIHSPGDRVAEVDAVIWLAAAGDDVPEGITTVIDVAEPHRSTVRTPEGVSEIEVECLSREQFLEIARECAASDDTTDAVPDEVALSDLLQFCGAEGLPATIGRGEGHDVVVDIVDDGPHAIVTGTTGTGKSELLVTWVAAIASAHGPDRVNFVLADFKGGTAFEPLRDLPQVVAVITDLDEHGARRGVSSLTAELRRREGALAAFRVRDIRDTSMPRLVIVVDEFAALLQEHPDLGAVFTDIAARGRALGMHLILGTQRASGVVKDALAANCPLRISLRVSDPADSRVVIGTEAAAEIPGGAEARGLGLVRRPQDAGPAAVRVALTTASDVRALSGHWAHAPASPSPWLPALPASLALAELIDGQSASTGSVIWGLQDDPENQAQPPLTVRVGGERGVALIGALGSGRTTALNALRAQVSDALWIPRDAEQMWDFVEAVASGEARLPSLVLCDDLDARISDLPAEYAQQLVQRWEQILRADSGTTFALSAMRSTGPVGRILDVLPRRVLLRAASRVEHIAAGGESSTFDTRLPPGRGFTEGRSVQFAWTGDHADHADSGQLCAQWTPSATLTAIVTAGAPSVVSALRGAHPEVEVRLLETPRSGDRPGERESGVRPSGGATVPQVIVGDAESWQRDWALWQRARAEGEVLIRAERPSDLRQLAGVRELPPYARLHAGRVWALRGAEQPRRLVVPSLVAASPSTARSVDIPNAMTAAGGAAKPLTRRQRRALE